jgi:phytoene dehydrogenase-like protein
MPDCDVLVIGAGHNALVCAAYLAKAGYRVIVTERRPIVGGAVVTEEIVAGFKFDLGGSAHILIHHTPIVQELELAKYGLEYIDLDPLFFAPFPDGTHITIWKDVDQTCESIAAISPADAEAYRQFIDKWEPVSRAIVEAFLHSPTPLNLARYMVFGSKIGRDSRWDQLTDLLRGYGQVMRQSFSSAQVQALIGWMAAQSGPPPSEPFSAPFALWHPMYHVSGVKRPRGGSGMLTQALAKMIEAHGGQIMTGAPVKRILVEKGRVIGAEVEDAARITARKVVSGAHIHTTMCLLGAENIPAQARGLLERARVGNGFGMIVRYAMNELPNYTALPSGDKPGPQHSALQFICPDLAYLERAYADYLAGMPSKNPALISMTFSAVDPTLAPPGKHTLFLWGQYYPYELASGASWDNIAQETADHMLNTLAQYAPNVKNAVIDQLIETPLYLERTLGLLRGNVMHLEMSIDQMFMLRPALTMSNYRGPLPGLYLTGASTHPGGGIMGAAGRNAAVVLLHDLSRFGRIFK